jgi:hypothetical protein
VSLSRDRSGGSHYGIKSDGTFPNLRKWDYPTYRLNEAKQHPDFNHHTNPVEHVAYRSFQSSIC